MPAPQLVVMAAGIGSRYGGLKQIDPVGPSGEIVLDYAVHDAISAGFGKVVFIIRKEIEEAFRDVVGRTIEKQIDTAYAFQELSNLPQGFSLPPGRTKPWGTAHAVFCAEAHIDAPFAVINADDFYGRQSFCVLADHLRTAEDSAGVYDYAMVGFVLRNTLTEHGHVARGICTVDDGGLLTSVIERTKIEKSGRDARYGDGDQWIELSGQSVVSMNMWGLTVSFMGEVRERLPAFLTAHADEPKAEFFIPTLINGLVQEGRAAVKVLHSDEKWLGVTYQQDKPKVKKAIAALVGEGIYPQSLWG